MARARNIKPGFFKNEDLAELSFGVRLLFIGLWTLADREGRLEDRPKRIKMELFPADDVDVDGGLSDLHNRGFVVRYEVDGIACIQVVNFAKHQAPHVREAPSSLPPCTNLGEAQHQPRQVQARTRDDTHLAESVRRFVIDRDGGRCLKCGTDQDLHVDHVIPRAHGGGTNPQNLQTLCRSCNQSKGARSGEDFRSTNLGKAEHLPRSPDSLNPSSLNPSSLNPDCLQKPVSAAPTISRSKPDSLDSGFAEFWAAYPKKVEKKAALAAWKAKRLNGKAQQVIEHVRKRAAQDQSWLDGYIPSPKRFIRDERWNDEFQEKLSHREKVLRALEENDRPVLEGSYRDE